MVGTVVGVGMFLVLLVFATQVLFGLYLTSVVDAVAYDAAKTAAGADALSRGPSGRAAITDTARAQLGSAGLKATFSWREDGDVVELDVRVPGPGLLPTFLRRDVVRSVRVRAERAR
jgi:hypothetical protein